MIVVTDARMHAHIHLVGLLYILAALLSMLVALSVFILGVGAISIGGWRGPRVAATVTGGLFIGTALLLTAWAALNGVVGVRLRQGNRPVARHLALAVAVIHLFLLPFGTALGVYGLWVLLHPDTRAHFEGA